MNSETLRTKPTDEERERFGMFPEHTLFTHEEFFLFKNYLKDRQAAINATLIRRSGSTTNESMIRLREEERVLRYISDALYDIWFKRNLYRYLPSTNSSNNDND